MNRTEEFRTLCASYNELSFPIEESLCRAKSRRRRRTAARAGGCALGVLLAFCITVNLLPGVTVVLAKVPVLRQFTSLFLLSPSLRDAVSSDYYTLLHTPFSAESGLTGTVDGVIADSLSVYVFFRTDTPVRCEQFAVTASNGTVSYSSLVDEDGTRFCMEIVFTEETKCSSVSLSLTLTEENGTAHDVSFSVPVEQQTILESRTIPIGKTVLIEGHSVLIERLTLTPTAAVLTAQTEDDAVTSLSFAVTCKDGTRFVQSDGIRSIRDGNTILSYANSPYFSASEPFELSVFGARVQTSVCVDLESGAVTPPTSSFAVESVEWKDDCAVIRATVPNGAVPTSYRDESGVLCPFFMEESSDPGDSAVFLFTQPHPGKVITLDVPHTVSIASPFVYSLVQ